MSIVLIYIICVLILIAGYFFYGKRLERNLVQDFNRVMPSFEYNDGVDYVPTPTPVLIGHHFSSIAGAGPIVGPIIAAVAFGWLPALLWIMIGAIFIGAVHDYVSALASVNSGGLSIGSICKKYLSFGAYITMLLFLLFSLSYVIIVFLDLTAGTMTPSADEGNFSPNGAVATASLLYIVLALIYGLLVYKLKIDFKKLSFVFVPLVFLAIFAGWKFPISYKLLSHLAVEPKTFWLIVLIIYCYLASIMPVWLLLQPRDYLSAFLLYACIGFGFVGLLISGLTGKISIEQGSAIFFYSEKLGYIYPVLFITVACGAVSGFHSLVSAGTTAKQVKEKKSVLPVTYGSMLVEAALAVLAVISVMIVAKVPQGQLPPQTFANAIGVFASSCGLPSAFGVSFALLALNTFLLTTLDTCTRLTRFILEELISVNFPLKRYLASLIAIIFPSIICFIHIGGEPAWKVIWPVFGTTNQLLAALTLLIVSVWLYRSGRKVIYTVIPMIFMLFTALISLFMIAVKFTLGGNYFIGIISILMIVLTFLLLFDVIRMRKNLVKG